MNEHTPTSTRLTSAIAIVVCWLTATSIGRVVDVRLSIAVVAIVGAVACALLQPALFRRLFAPSASRAVIGVAAGLVMIAATYVLYPILARVDPALSTSTRSLYGLMHVPRATVPILIIVGLIVVGEEVLWRGAVQEAIQARFRPVWSIVMSAVVYGLAHAPIGSPLLVIVAIVCGLYWSTLRDRTGSLWPSLIAHLLWDMSILIHPLVS